MNRGVIFVAYGVNAQREAASAVRSVRTWAPDLEIAVIGQHVNGIDSVIHWPNRDGYGRDAKTSLYELSPFDQTLYLDADTRANADLMTGFRILDDGFDMVIVPSSCRGSDWLWHLGPEERVTTREEHAGQLLTLGGGVIWFAKNERSEAVFRSWREEWLRWQGQDQGALMRAYVKNPSRIWLLSRAWNGGPCIEHRYGAARGVA